MILRPFYEAKLVARLSDRKLEQWFRKQCQQDTEQELQYSVEFLEKLSSDSIDKLRTIVFEAVAKFRTENGFKQRVEKK